MHSLETLAIDTVVNIAAVVLLVSPMKTICKSFLSKIEFSLFDIAPVSKGRVHRLASLLIGDEFKQWVPLTIWETKVAYFICSL